MSVALLVMVLLALFDWNWLRGPLNAYISSKTQRDFSSSDLHVRWGLSPTIRLRDVYFSNAPWADRSQPMAKFKVLEFSLSLRDLFAGRILIPRVAVTDGELHLERLRDDRKNWIISDPSDRSPSRLRISSLSVTRGALDYVDHGLPFSLHVAVSTFDPSVAVTDAKAPPVNKSFTTRYVFGGKYHDATFSGDALTGDVLSFEESGIDFPIRGHLGAGTTALDIDGTVADAANISAIDVSLRISGQTLANLYPFLLLPLPASPPYHLEGRLTQRGSRYELSNLRGQIGSTDVAGSGAYIEKSPRPLLQANLHSERLDLADLGPLIGVTTKTSSTTAPPKQSETSDRSVAKETERQTSGERILPAGTPGGERLLPTGKLEGGRLKAIDAEAELTAKHIQSPEKLSVNNLRVGLHLANAIIKLDPFDLDFAGGQILSTMGMDATQPVLSARVDVRLQQLKLSELLPSSAKIVPSSGLVDGRLALSGAGDSIADIAAKSDGQISAKLAGGEISNLVDAAASLNGGKVIRLLVGGDRQIAVRCGAALFDVKAGQGKSKLLVVDTEQTRIDAQGGFDLGKERFDITITPRPKHPGVLSFRTPVRLFGTFRDPDYALDKKQLAMRVGSAVALAVVAPMAALIPLVETGPGSDVNCADLPAASGTSARKASTPGGSSKEK